MFRTMLCCAAMLAIPAFADSPKLAGAWKGTADRTVCGQSAGAVEVVLLLDGQESKLPNAIEQIIGNLMVGGQTDGAVHLLYNPKTASVSTALGTTRYTQSSFLAQLSPATTYWIDLKPGDAWGGVGYYQSLTGKLERRHSSCMNMGDTGDVLTVKLKKM